MDTGAGVHCLPRPVSLQKLDFHPVAEEQRRLSPELVRIRPTSCRFAEVRQELQTEMDQLPEAGHQEGQVQLAGRTDHHPASCSPWQQVCSGFYVVFLLRLLQHSYQLKLPSE